MKNPKFIDLFREKEAEDFLNNLLLLTCRIRENKGQKRSAVVGFADGITNKTELKLLGHVGKDKENEHSRLIFKQFTMVLMSRQRSLLIRDHSKEIVAGGIPWGSNIIATAGMIPDTLNEAISIGCLAYSYVKRDTNLEFGSIEFYETIRNYMMKLFREAFQDNLTVRALAMKVTDMVNM